MWQGSLLTKYCISMIRNPMSDQVVSTTCAFHVNNIKRLKQHYILGEVGGRRFMYHTSFLAYTKQFVYFKKIVLFDFNFMIVGVERVEEEERKIILK